MCCTDSGAADGVSDFNKMCSGHKLGAEARDLNPCEPLMLVGGGAPPQTQGRADEVFTRITTQFWAEPKGDGECNQGADLPSLRFSHVSRAFPLSPHTH